MSIHAYDPDNTSITYLADVSPAVELTPAQVLQRAADRDLDGVIVIGITQDCSMYADTSISDGPDVIWLLEKMKHQIMTAASK